VRVLLSLLPAILCLSAFAAHLIRNGLGAVGLLVPFLLCLLFVPRGWVARLFQMLLLVTAFEWVRTTVIIAAERREAGAPWLRMAIIMGVVTLFTLFAAALFEGKTLQRVYPRASEW